MGVEKIWRPIEGVNHFGVLCNADSTVSQGSIGSTFVKVQPANTQIALATNITASTTNFRLTVEYGGVYACFTQLSFSGTGNRDFEFCIHDTATATSWKARRRLGAGGDIGSASLFAMFNMDRDDYAECFVLSTGAGGSITVRDWQFALWRVGD